MQENKRLNFPFQKKGNLESFDFVSRKTPMITLQHVSRARWD
jgi:hypothetical protein